MKSKVSICAIIKDEQLFLEEWINWHLNLGFTAIHLFEDKNSRSHESICSKYSNVFLRRYETDGQIREILKDQKTARRQKSLYEWFGNNYKNIYDWAAFIDVDEFLMFSGNYNLSSLCKEFESYSAIFLNWKIMTANGHTMKPETGVIQAYTEEISFHECGLTTPHKSFCNLNRWEGLKNHHTANNAVNTNHCDKGYELLYDKAWLNHYFTKSWEDWCRTIFERGCTQSGHRKLEQFFMINKNMEHMKSELIEGISNKKPYRSEDTEDLILENNLIFDLGFFKGDTAEFYLNNNYRVIGIECNPNLRDFNNEKFLEYITSGKLKLIEKCISDNDNSIIPFYISRQTIWSSANINIAERRCKSTEVMVETITLSTLIKNFGCPIYCKIDIEGNDVLAVKSLLGSEYIPEYISVEAECLWPGKEVADVSLLDELVKVGYSQFLIKDQRRFSSFRFDPKGQYEWLSYEDAKLELDFLRKYDWDYGLWVDIYGKRKCGEE